MGNCSGECGCTESRKERQAMKEYKQSMQKPTPRPVDNVPSPSAV